MNAEKFPPRFTRLLLESHIHKFAARPFWPFDIHRLAPKHSASEQKREHGEACNRPTATVLDSVLISNS